MINGVGGRCLAFVTALSLNACSVLQIDVGEYKGPMANHEDIQLQQYVALATSAKPLIVALRNNYILDDESYEFARNSDKEEDRACLQSKNQKDIDDYIGCTFKLDIAYFLNSILALYENTDVLTSKINHYRPAQVEHSVPLIQQFSFSRKQKRIFPLRMTLEITLG